MKISIITPTYNSEKYIEETIQSLIKQDYRNIEYIVVDGGSQDRTIDIIKDYSSVVTKFISEPDKGIYDAFNKGIRLATGDVIYFLNSDDYLSSSTIISEVASLFTSDETIEMVYGNVEFVDNTAPYRFISGKELSLGDLRQGAMCPHQGVFVRKKLFDEFAFFDLSYKLASDFDFVIKCFLCNKTTFYMAKTIAVSRDWGASSNPTSRRLLIDEQNAIIIKHFGTLPSSRVSNVDVNGIFRSWLDVILLRKRGISGVLKRYGVRRVAIFGTMRTGLYLLEDLYREQFYVTCFLDNNINMLKKYVSGIEVKSPSWLIENPREADAVIISIESDRDIEVKDELARLYMGCNIRIVTWKELVRLSLEE